MQALNASTKRYQALNAISKRYLQTLPLMGATRLASEKEAAFI